ncbi:translation initiation factor IF-1 [Patescibacteria group bacterium]|nr:translation initiation factor IF-1 [Patescibacteria group bacterium]
MSNSSKQQETVIGTVDEALPNTLFRVTLENGEKLLTFLSGKMRMYRIRVLVGDKVEIILDQYGGKGRIIRRF